MTVKINAWQLVNRIHDLLGVRHKEGMYEGRLTRSLYEPVSGILVANEPSIDAVRLAIATGRNCILCRDHPYYLFGEHWSRGVEAELANDPVLKAKRALIEDNGILIIRLASLWDDARPKWFSGALARALGWKADADVPGDQSSAVYCSVPETPFLALSEFIAQRLGAKTLRNVGAPDLLVKRVAVIHGLAFPTLVFSHVLRDRTVDLIVTGTTPEVDFNTSYIRDAVTAGRKVGLMQIGYEKSEYPGAVEVAAWLRTAFPGMPVDVQPALLEQSWLA